jgi:hypothetical protein
MLVEAEISGPMKWSAGDFMSCSAMHRHKDLRSLFELGMLRGVTVD